MNLCLGTVQFGMEYGIAKDKQPSLENVFKIIDYAIAHGINSIDTAKGYGIAEEIVGKYLAQTSYQRENLFIISKVGNCLDNIPCLQYYEILKKEIEKSLEVLHTSYIDSYLFHCATYSFDDAKLEVLAKIKELEYIRHCGVSVYYPDEAIAAIRSGLVDFIQLPCNMFDNRFYLKGVFNLALEKNVTIHSRSVFLQGLFSMINKKLPPFLEKAYPYLDQLQVLAKENDISVLEMAMAYVKHFSAIKNIVIGVNSLEQLQANIAMFEKNIDETLFQTIQMNFSSVDEKIFLPIFWK